MAFLLHTTKGSPLTWAEVDMNFAYLLELFTSLQELDVPIDAPVGRVLTNADYGRVINCDAPTPQTFTLAAGLMQGFRCAFVQAGAGQVIVAAGSAQLVNVDGHYGSSGVGGVLTVINNSTDSYVLGGNTAP